MKRKFIVIFLVVSLSLSLLIGCSNKKAETTTDEITGELVDGTYLVKDPVSDHGNYGMAIMEVKNGEISSFKYVEILAQSGEEKNENNYQYKEGLDVIESLNKQFNETKSLDKVDFDAVTGATHTKENFKRIVNELLEKAVNGDTYKPVYKDGEYIAKADKDNHGWLGEVKVVVREGQIVGVDYYEIATKDMESNKVVFNEENEPIIGDDGKPKTEPVQVKAGDVKSEENYAYLNSFEVETKMERLIIDNNGTKNLDVDSVTGATSTKNILVELVNKALEDAKL